jgi:hypothetical protein
MCTRCGHLSKHDAAVNKGFGSGLSTVASDRAPEREACSARARFVGTVIFKKIVRRRNFMKSTILITSLAAAFGLSINAAAQSSAAQQGAPTVKRGSALKAKAASPAPISHSQEQVPENNDRQGQGRGKGPPLHPCTGRKKLTCTTTAALRPLSFSMTLSAALSTPTVKMLSPVRIANLRRPAFSRPFTPPATKPVCRWARVLYRRPER